MAELLLAKGKIMASYRLEDYDFVSLSKHAKKRRVHERLLILAHINTADIFYNFLTQNRTLLGSNSTIITHLIIDLRDFLAFQA